MHLSRRGLLAGAAAGGGLLIAFALLPRGYDAPLAPRAGESAFGAWLRIGRDGIVTIALPQLEMGQGVSTLLPQIVAMELGADWRQIAVEPVPPSGAYPNVALAEYWSALWATPGSGSFGAARWAANGNFTATAAGTTLAAYEQPCREAGAAARAMLAMAAAERWDVDWEACEVIGGTVRHQGKALRFGALADDAARLPPPDPPPLRAQAPSDAEIPIEDGALSVFPRLDLPSKSDGSYLFAGDVRLPDMVFGAVRCGPLGESALTGLDRTAAEKVPGFIALAEGDNWLAAAAADSWSAERVLAAAAPRFIVTGAPATSGIDATLDYAIRHGAGSRIAERGAGDAALDKVDFGARYDFAPALHAPLENASAAARLADGRLEVWVASQAPEQARLAAAAAAGISPARTVLYPMPAGGSFDRRLEHDQLGIAVRLAIAAGRPVSLTLTRWQEMLLTRPRAPAAATVGVRLAAGGAIAAWRTRIATQASTQELGARLFADSSAAEALADVADTADALAVEGGLPEYGIPDAVLDHVPVAGMVPAGRMRGGAHGITAFVTETAVDELAARLGQEPLSYRIRLLAHDLRMVACLQAAARLGAWDGGGNRSGQGLACHWMRLGETSGRIACVATARQGPRGIEVMHLAAALDIGRVINRDIAVQQVEGGLIYGLSLALGSATHYAGGLPTHGKLRELALPVLAGSPDIRVDFIASDAPPFDPGELPVAVAAPALGNALYSATGIRLRRLPFMMSPA